MGMRIVRGLTEVIKRILNKLIGPMKPRRQKMFAKWKRLLQRIYDEQLFGLAVHRHIHRQFAEVTQPHVGTGLAGDLAEWININYLAYAGVSVRKMVEMEPRHPKKGQASLSLVILLEQIKRHPSLLTRANYHRRYKKRHPVFYDPYIPMQAVVNAFGIQPRARQTAYSLLLQGVNQNFARIAQRKGAVDLVATLDRDLERMQRHAAPIKRLVNKVIGHTELDRRKKGRQTYNQLNRAIDTLIETYERWYQFLHLRRDTRIPSIPKEHDVTAELKRIWP